MTNNKITNYPILEIAGVSILAGIFYWLTASRLAGYIDSGELATACYYLGIPHPTGCPLYVNLGRLAIMVLPGTPIWRCVLLSLFLTAGSVGILFSLIKSILPKSTFSKPIAASIALFMAFSPVWWAQGTGNEVYCLTLLANLWALSCLVKYAACKSARYLLGGFYLWGLSFGAHMSSIFLLPAVAYLTISTDGIKHLIRPRYLWAASFFVVALSVYIYLPIRAAFKPFLNWSNPAGFQGLLNHISGWQYRVWMFKSLAKMTDGLGYFGKLLYQQFGIIGIVLIVIGGFFLFSKRLRLAVFFTLIIIADIFYSANYEIADIDTYYLLAFASFAVFAAAGFLAIADTSANLKFFRGNPRTIKSVIFLCIAIIPITNLSSNYSGQDESHIKYVEAGVTNILNSMEPDGIAFIENWDFYSPWLYYHYLENVRPDAILIDKELLRRSWYIDFLKRYHLDIMAGAQIEIGAFLDAVKSFESGGQYDSQKLTLTFRAMVDALIASNIAKRPIYANFQSDDMYSFKQAIIPIGSLYKLENTPRYIAFDISKVDIGAWESPKFPPDNRSKAALYYVYKITRDRAMFCHQLGNDTEAKSYIDLTNRIKTILDKP